MASDGSARWEQAYRAEGPRLWRALFLVTADPDVASDVMAEAFAQGIARGDAVRKPGAWVWRAAFAILGGELQHRGRTIALDPSAAEVPAPDLALDVRRALRTLSPRQRTVIVLRYYGGYSIAQIASIVGSSRSSVAVHLFRARGALRRRLEAADED